MAARARIRVVQTEHLAAAAAAWLGERCELVVCAHDDPRFREAIAEADGLVVRTYTIVGGALLDASPRLRVVGRAGVGLDNIDLAACRARGIAVVHTPDANTQAVVEYVVCLLGDALRPRFALERALSPAEWNRLRAETVGTRQMDELTLGVLGLGRVGRRVAEVAAAIGMRVLFNDLIDPKPARGSAIRVPVEALFAESDVLSIHIDGRASNAKFVNATLIDGMKRDVVFINTSRGFVVDTTALAAWLRAHPRALAMLDVHDPEPIGPDDVMLGVSNARLYPHLASRTERAMENMSWVVEDVLAVLEGRAPRFPAPDHAA